MPIRLKASRPAPFPQAPQTLGDHIKRRRLALRLTQKEAAKLLAAGAYTVLNWEKNKAAPPIRAIPAILRFLGYDPFPPPNSLAERLLAKRRQMGWSIEKAASQLGVDEGTWAAWERGAVIPQERYRVTVEGFLEALDN